MAISSAPRRGGHTVRHGRLTIVVAAIAAGDGNPSQVTANVTGTGAITRG